MRSMRNLGLLCLPALLAGLGPAPAALGQSAPGTGEYPAISVPSKRHKLSFNASGILKEIPPTIKEGVAVKENELLMKQDDRMEQKLLEAMQIEANSQLPVEAALKEWENRKVTLERIKRMYNATPRVATEAELQEATINEQIAEIKHKQAQEEMRQKQKQLERQAIKVQQMELRSPVGGIVERLDASIGEIIDPTKPACVVISNDPLWVETHLPAAVAGTLRLGQAFPVRYEGHGDWRAARLIFKAPMADAASGTQLVRLELDNSADKQDSGLQMVVKVTPASPSTAPAAAIDAASSTPQRKAGEP